MFIFSLTHTQGESVVEGWLLQSLMNNKQGLRGGPREASRQIYVIDFFTFSSFRLVASKFPTFVFMHA